MSNIEDRLRKLACEATILLAAKVYAAGLDSSVDYDGFMLMDSDKVVCTPDKKIASKRKRIEWTKWRWLQWASSPSDLTLTGCIRFIIEDSEDDGPDDSVTFEEVLAVLKGSQT